MIKPPMKDTTLKGLVHLGLTLLAAYEAHDSDHRPRRFLLGCMAGFHAHATLYHFLIEPFEGNKESK